MPFIEVLIGAAISAVAVYGAIVVVSTIAEFIYNNLIFQTPPDTIEHTHSSAFAYSDTDKAYVKASQTVLTEVLGSDPINSILAMNAEERIKSIECLTNKLATLYQLEDIHIVIKQNSDLTELGEYCVKTHTITLNLTYLQTTNSECVKYFLETVFHEFRHAVQWKMICSFDQAPYVWSDDEQTIRKMAESWLNYVEFSENSRLYYEQYIELDAREISWYVLEEEC